MTTISRRHLLATSIGGTAGLMVGPGLRAAFANSGASGSILVVLFLRGGADGLTLAAPVNDPNYIAARPTLAVKASGGNAGLPISGGIAGIDFRLHSSASGLKTLYDQGRLAIVHAVGLTSASRSHFKSMDLMECGFGDGEDVQPNGWLARHLAVVGDGTGVLPIATANFKLDLSLFGDGVAVAIPEVVTFALANDQINRALIRQICSGSSDYARIGARTIATAGAIDDIVPKDAQGNIKRYQPAPGVDYGQGQLATGLQTVAQLIKLNVGLNVATVDFDLWDTHGDQAAQIQTQISQLSQAVSAFWADLADYQSRLTLVAMTEFGRRVKENANGGTDHGYGSVMLALGGAVKGGRIYGTWPGLAPSQLDQGLDLAITTDYRQVLADILIGQGNSRIDLVFPTITYSPLGILGG